MVYPNPPSMTAPDDLNTTAPPASVKPAGLWEDFIDIFVSPAEVFERRRDSGFFLVLVILTIILVAITLIGNNVMQSVLQSDFARGMAAAAKKNPNLTSDQIAASSSLMTKFTPVIVGFGAFVLPLVVGLILWIAGKLVSAKETVGQACMIAVYAAFPRVIDSLLRMIQAFLLDPSKVNGMASISVSPARFMNPDVTSPTIVALAGRFDLFTIWATVLLAIGLSVVARIPRSRGAIAAIIVWVIASLPVIFSALRAS